MCTAPQRCLRIMNSQQKFEESVVFPFQQIKCYSLGTLLGFICQLRALQPKATLTKVADLASLDAFSAFPAEAMWDIRVRKKSLSLSFPSS